MRLLHPDCITTRGGNAREAAETAQRRTWTRPTDDQMAIAGALLTPEQAVTWAAGMDALERRERLADRSAGITRTAEQCRADLFAALPALVLAHPGRRHERGRHEQIVAMLRPALVVDRDEPPARPVRQPSTCASTHHPGAATPVRQIRIRTTTRPAARAPHRRRRSRNRSPNRSPATSTAGTTSHPSDSAPLSGQS